MTDVDALLRIILREPALWATLLGAGTLLAGLGLLLTRRSNWPRWRRLALVAAGYASALLPATTLARTHEGVYWRIPYAGADLLRSASLVPDTATEILNLAMLVPFGFLATLATRRTTAVMVTAAVAVLAVEVVQGASGLGVMQLQDLVFNVAGAAGGALAARAFAATARLPSTPHERGAATR